MNYMKDIIDAYLISKTNNSRWKKTERMRRLVIDPNTKSDTISTFHTTYNIVEAKTSALTKNK